MNAICHDQKLKKGSLEHCEPVMLVAPPYVEQSQVQDPTPELEDMITGAKLNLSDAES
jgi:hypothetical protein